MAFRDFRKGLMDQHERVKDFIITPIIEELTLSSANPKYMNTGEHVKIEIGATLSVIVNESTWDDPKPLSRLYKLHRKQLEGVLAIIKKKADITCEQKDIMIAAMTEAVLPSAVLKQMRGESKDMDDEQLLNMVVEKKCKELAKALPNPTAGEFSFLLGIIGGIAFSVSQDANILQVYFGKINIYRYRSSLSNYSSTAAIRQQMLFVANYDYIETKVRAFLADMSVIAKKWAMKENDE